MAQETKIEWTDVSWNPTHGCSHVSDGCKHCYAETTSLRFGHTVKPWTAGNAAENVILKPKKLLEPLSGRKPFDVPRLVFVNSMSDVFHEQIPNEYIVRMFAVMATARQHTFQILTKRPERMRDLLGDIAFWLDVGDEVREIDDDDRLARQISMAAVDSSEIWAKNIWLGTSIESRRHVDRADILRATPAQVRFISAEPLLGPLVGDRDCDCGVPSWEGAGQHAAGCRCLAPDIDLRGIDWLICGGESGPDHRPMDLAWARDLRDACMGTFPIPLMGGYMDNDLIPDDDGSGTLFFMKQLGGARPGTDLDDLPEDLRIRDMPEVRAAAT
jgi:protein gp37